MADPAADHAELSDGFASRRYFRTFETITGHLLRVVGTMQADGGVGAEEAKVLTRHLLAISHTLRALSMKYLMAGRGAGRHFGTLTMDRRDSGFPVAAELMTMANDAQQAAVHLANMPSSEQLKDEMIEAIVGRREAPARLQFALSQRLYYEELLRGGLFWMRIDPDCRWLGDAGPGRRRFMIDWAVYDSQINLPVIYLMEVEDDGRLALPKDQRRWPEVQAHLMAQSLGGLKPVTIARGFDRDFDDLHPKRLRRIHVGPLYSAAFTDQTGPLRAVMDEARASEGQDWALAWTVEDLESERVSEERAGWFATVEREVFALDPFGGRGADTGATAVRRSLILPQRPFQVLAEKNPPGFAEVRKFVVGPTGQVLRY